MSNPIIESVKDKYCVIRGRSFGVFAGTVKEVDGDCIQVENARRLWYWDGAASISQIAVEGVTDPAACKFTMVVDSIVLRDWIEIIPATEHAQKSVEGVKVWKRQ